MSYHSIVAGQVNRVTTCVIIRGFQNAFRGHGHVLHPFLAIGSVLALTYPVIWSSCERALAKFPVFAAVFGQLQGSCWTLTMGLGMAPFHDLLLFRIQGSMTLLRAILCTFAFVVLGAGPGAAAPDYMGTEGPPIRFKAVLSADEQSAPTESPGTGVAEFILDRPTQRLDWEVNFGGLTSDATGAHVHGPQTPGGNAGVLFDLAPNGVSSPLKGSVVLNDGELEYLLTGRMYVNIHTTKYPPGELRGQVMRQRPEEP